MEEPETLRCFFVFLVRFLITDSSLMDCGMARSSFWANRAINNSCYGSYGIAARFASTGRPNSHAFNGRHGADLRSASSSTGSSFRTASLGLANN